ncbi:MAG: cytochrome c-type biogenesis protein CcmH [Gammaproteobacteria bacterium AqS3]|nr:cytochrome c-type biogenesis protein CcmH [Gammaproteobacteria bacterium AqS3]
MRLAGASVLAALLVLLTLSLNAAAGGQGGGEVVNLAIISSEELEAKQAEEAREAEEAKKAEEAEQAKQAEEGGQAGQQTEQTEEGGTQQDAAADAQDIQDAQAATGAADTGTAEPPDASGLEDEALRERYYSLIRQLRCPQCAGQSLGDSEADLAVDMRFQIRYMLKEGATDLQVFSWMTERYGEEVLLNPPVNPVTFLLWAGVPIIMLLMIGLMIGRRVTTIQRRHRRR